MSNLGTRNNLLLTKIESTPGTFETMAATADAIAVEGLNPPTPNAITIPDNSAQASLDGLGTEVGGGAGKELGLGDDLGVHLEPDDHLPIAAFTLDQVSHGA